MLAEPLVAGDGGKPIARTGTTIDEKLWAAIKEHKVAGVRVRPVVTGEIEYLAADEEERYYIAQANAPLDDGQHFTEERVMVRFRDEFRVQPAEDVDYMDVSPKQIVSVATAMIPFLEHDDANRALMGSNMMRQSVPLLQPEAPGGRHGRGVPRRLRLPAGGGGSRPAAPWWASPAPRSWSSATRATSGTRTS